VQISACGRLRERGEPNARSLKAAGQAELKSLFFNFSRNEWIERNREQRKESSKEGTEECREFSMAGASPGKEEVC
jgi:hypothetical protein